jgi:dTDP-4-amino-4,6-dideoxygalactose transaminase
MTVPFVADSPRLAAWSNLATVSGYDIPFNRVAFAGREREYIADAVGRSHISGDGHYTRLCHEFLQSSLGVSRVLLTTSCTHALEMAALLLGLGPGDEVIVPSFAFVSTVNAFVLRGVRPVFCDIRRDTMNLDEMQLESLVTPHTRAIVPLHYAGVGCEMDRILEIAGRHGVAVVEDNAHGLFGRYREKWLGTFGQFAAQSFHETKNFQCGEGGALLINDPADIERAEIIREKGTNRRRFLEGQVDKYTWVDIGSSYLPSDLLAAYLYAQLEVRDRIQAARHRIWTTYSRELADWACQLNVGLPVVPAHCDQPFHMFYLVMDSRVARDALIAHLKRRGIMAVFHYLPLHLSAMGQRFGGRESDCPVTEDISDRLVRLPFYTGMTEAEQATIINAIEECRH